MRGENGKSNLKRGSELNSEDLVEGSLVWAKIKVGLLDFGVFNFPTFVCSRAILTGPVWSPETQQMESSLKFLTLSLKHRKNVMFCF